MRVYHKDAHHLTTAFPKIKAKKIKQLFSSDSRQNGRFMLPILPKVHSSLKITTLSRKKKKNAQYYLFKKKFICLFKILGCGDF